MAQSTHQVRSDLEQAPDDGVRAHGAPLRLEQEVEHYVRAVAEQQQVLGLQIAHALCRRQLPRPHLRSRTTHVRARIIYMQPG